VNDSRGLSQSLHRYVIQGMEVALVIPPEVFVPSPHTLGLAKHIRIAPGERLADIGTGSGIMAILAARLGATVLATDISDMAVAAAQANARRNDAFIDVRQGDLFGDLEDRFDVIVANLPQACFDAGRLVTMSPALRLAIDGGEHGNAVLLRFLQACRPRMHDRTRLYVSVDTETDYLATLSNMLGNFDVRLLGVYDHELHDTINDSADSYRRLNELGEICVFTRNGRLHGLQFVMELTATSARRS
jgi:HemK-related putative methylase